MWCKKTIRIYLLFWFRFRFSDVGWKAENIPMPATDTKKSGGFKFEFSEKQMAKEAFLLFFKDDSGPFETKKLKVCVFVFVF